MYFSVVVPTHNRINYLKRILDYFLYTYSRHSYEIIIIDGFSTDHTDRLVKSHFLYKKGLVTYVENVPINTPSCKRNLGIDHSTGQWIIFLDDDCTPVGDFLGDYHYSITRYVSPLVCHLGRISYPAELVRTSNYFRYRESRHLGSPNRIVGKNVKIKSNNIVTMNMAVNRASIMSSSLKFDETITFFGEDIKFGQNLYKRGFYFCMANSRVVHNETVGNVMAWYAKLSAPFLLPSNKLLLLEALSIRIDQPVVSLYRYIYSIPPIRFLIRWFLLVPSVCIVVILTLTDKFTMLYQPVLYLLVERLLFLSSFFA